MIGGHDRSVAVFAVVLSLALRAGSLSGEVPRQTPSRRGVVVEQVGKGSAAEQAGIQPGDVLLSWVRAASPPANPTEARGEITSPFDCPMIEVEEGPRGVITVTGARERQSFSAVLPPGEWKITSRPQMPETLLATYRQGKSLVDAGQIDKGVTLWREAAEKLKSESAPIVAAWLLLKTADTLAEARQWNEAQAEYEAAIDAAKTEPLRDVLVTIWEALGATLSRQDRLSEAEPIYRRQLEMIEQVAPASLRAAKALDQIAFVALGSGRLEVAEQFYERSRRLRERHAPDSLALAASFNGLGIVATSKGDLGAGESFFRRSLFIQQTQAPDSLASANSLNNLGIIAVRRGDLASAEALYKQSLAVRSSRAPGTIVVADSMNNLAEVAARRGDLAYAAELLRNSVLITERLEPNGLKIARRLSNLANIAKNQGDLEAAQEFQRRALDIHSRIAPNSAYTAGMISSLGELAQIRGDLAFAEELNTRALTIVETYAPDSLDAARILGNLGRVAESRGDLAAAEQLHQRGLAIEKKLAPRSLAFTTSLSDLADLAAKRGDTRIARDLSGRPLDICTSPRTVCSMNGFHSIPRSRSAFPRSLPRGKTTACSRPGRSSSTCGSTPIW